MTKRMTRESKLTPALCLIVALVLGPSRSMGSAQKAQQQPPDDSAIKVSNHEHTIYLDGVVNSWDAMDTALDTAWSAPGVREVVNNLALID